MNKKLLVLGSIFLSGISLNAQVLSGTFVGRYATGIFDKGATEIAAYDPSSKKIFSVNGSTGKVDVIDFSNPAAPSLVSTIDLAPYGIAANSVSIYGGILACAVEATVKQDNGKVVFFNTAGDHLKTVDVGALPDMITYTPDGKTLIVCNEGEPTSDYATDPVGSISIIDISAGVSSATVTNLTFNAYNGKEDSLRALGIRIFGPGASAAQDFEPEYATVSADSKSAWVVLQENNAMVLVDLVTKTIKEIKPLGFKDHSVSGKGLDASDRNSSTINIATHPIKGMYMPDGLSSIKYNGKTYILSANEGDARDYGTNADVSKQMVEEITVKSLTLDATAFPTAATLKTDAVLGRLNVTKTMGDTDKDGDYDALYAFGARSFSIWDSSMTLIYDSGDQMEQYIAANYPSSFNVSSTNNTKQNRSDNKGPEPEAVITATFAGKTYAFVGLERFGGVMVYDVTNPMNVVFETYFTSRDFSTTPGANTAGGDLAPEGLLYISATNSPTGKPYLLSSNETSGSIAVYELAGSVVTSDEELNIGQSEFKVYPNPNSSGILNFNQTATGKMFNVNGSVVSLFQNTQQVNIQHLSPGFYILKNDKGESVKVIVQ